MTQHQLEPLNVQGVPNLVFAERFSLQAANYFVEVGVCEFPAAIRDIAYRDFRNELKPLRSMHKGPGISYYNKETKLYEYRIAVPPTLLVFARCISKSNGRWVVHNSHILAVFRTSKPFYETGFDLTSYSASFPNVEDDGYVCTGMYVQKKYRSFNEYAVEHVDNWWGAPFSSDFGELCDRYEQGDQAATFIKWAEASKKSMTAGLEYAMVAKEAMYSREPLGLDQLISDVATRSGGEERICGR